MAKFRLARKTYAVLGIGNVTKNWKSAESLWKSGNKGKALLSGAKSVGTGALYTGAGIAGAGALGAGAIAYKAGGGDLISGGEKSAKEMDFN